MKSDFFLFVLFLLLPFYTQPQEVAPLVNEESTFGGSASSLASGMYFYKLQTDVFVQTKKMDLMK